jgi:hypothetical protein
LAPHDANDDMPEDVLPFCCTSHSSAAFDAAEPRPELQQQAHVDAQPTHGDVLSRLEMVRAQLCMLRSAALPACCWINTRPCANNLCCLPAVGIDAVQAGIHIHATPLLSVLDSTT